ncbi:hypothetical protein NQ317_013072, partial [Molorchus minor]
MSSHSKHSQIPQDLAGQLDIKQDNSWTLPKLWRIRRAAADKTPPHSGSKAGVRRLQYPSRFALPHSPRFTKNIKVQNVLRFSINSRQSVFNTVYSVRCLKGQGSFQEAALIIFPSTPIKNTEDGMKRWLRRAKKRVNRTYESKEHY